MAQPPATIGLVSDALLEREVPTARTARCGITAYASKELGIRAQARRIGSIIGCALPPHRLRVEFRPSI